MAKKLKPTKLQVFDIARDFLGLTYQQKFSIGQHFMELNDGDIFMQESELELKVWAEANKNIANFNHFTELVEVNAEVAS